MDEVMIQVELDMTEAIANMTKRFNNIRAGRANPSVLDGIMVDYYGVSTSLRSLANISIPEAREIMIKPYDRGLLAGIEKAIYEANIGLTPNNNGETIILVVPALTEDTRKSYVKEVRDMAEEGRIAIRSARQEANNAIKKLDLPLDTEKSSLADVQALTDQYNKQIEALLTAKEKELMSI